MKQRKIFFPSKHYETLDTFSVVLFVICMSNSEMSTRMCQPGCVNQDVSKDGLTDENEDDFLLR